MLRTVIRPIRPDLTLRLGDGFSRKGNTQTETVFRVSVKNINSSTVMTETVTKCLGTHHLPCLYVLLMPLLRIK